MADSEERLDDYSRGRADAEVEYRDNLSTFRRLVENRTKDTQKNGKEYKGKEQISNRLMRSYYTGREGAYLDVLSILDFMEITDLEEEG